MPVVAKLLMLNNNYNTVFSLKWTLVRPGFTNFGPTGYLAYLKLWAVLRGIFKIF